MASSFNTAVKDNLWQSPALTCFSETITTCYPDAFKQSIWMINYSLVDVLHTLHTLLSHIHWSGWLHILMSLLTWLLTCSQFLCVVGLHKDHITESLKHYCYSMLLMQHFLFCIFLRHSWISVCKCFCVNMHLCKKPVCWVCSCLCKIEKFISNSSFWEY